MVDKVGQRPTKLFMFEASIANEKNGAKVKEKSQIMEKRERRSSAPKGEVCHQEHTNIAHQDSVHCDSQQHSDNTYSLVDKKHPKT